MFPSYAELHCLTNFSFLRGASHPEELVERAARLGYSALAITDECSLAGVVRAHVAAKGARHQADRRLRSCHSAVRRETAGLRAEGAALRIVLLATDRDRLRQSLRADHPRRRQAKKGEYRLTRSRSRRRRARLPRAAAAGSAAESRPRPLARAAFRGARWIAAELLRGPDDRARLEQLEQHAQEAGLPLVAAGDVHMHVRARRALQDTLTAMRLRHAARTLRPRAVSQRRAPSAPARAAGTPVSARAADRHARCRRALHFFSRQPALRVPRGDRAGGRDAGELAAQADRGRIQLEVRAGEEVDVALPRPGRGGGATRFETTKLQPPPASPFSRG